MCSDDKKVLGGKMKVYIEKIVNYMWKMFIYLMIVPCFYYVSLQYNIEITNNFNIIVQIIGSYPAIMVIYYIFISMINIFKKQKVMKND